MHPMNRSGYASRSRRAVTVVEVLFATGIVIFGLVGIASLLTVAGRQASDANRSAESHVLGQYWYKDFIVRGINSSASWVWFNDQLPGLPQNRFVAVDGSEVDRLTSSGGVRTRQRHAICIDPAFFADFSTIANLNRAFPISQAYRPGLFPYYQDDYDPRSDPTSPSSLGGNAARLLRCSLDNPLVADARPMTAKQVDSLFSSKDDISTQLDEDDKTIPPQRYYVAAGSQALSKAEYSWFATLSPREFLPGETASINAPESFYTLSIAVCHRRDRAFLYPTAGTPPTGERLAGIRSPHYAEDSSIPLTNFIGGAGGRIQLVAPISVDDTLLIGNWIMLCRHQPFTTAGGEAGLGTICRWYRVIGLDADAKEDKSTSTWYRNVVLSGPDWVFSPAYPTQATIVDGVVNVVERVIQVN